MRITKQQLKRIIQEEIIKEKVQQQRRSELFEKRVIIVQETIRALVENGDQQSLNQAVLLLKEENDRLDEKKGKGKRNAIKKRRQDKKRKKAAQDKERKKALAKNKSANTGSKSNQEDDEETKAREFNLAFRNAILSGDKEEQNRLMKQRVGNQVASNQKQQKAASDKGKNKANDKPDSIELGDDDIEIVPDKEKKKSKQSKPPPRRKKPKHIATKEQMEEWFGNEPIGVRLKQKLPGQIEFDGDTGDALFYTEEAWQALVDAWEERSGGEQGSEAQAWKAAAKEPKTIKLYDELEYWLAGITSQSGLRKEMIKSTKDWVDDLRMAVRKTQKIKGQEWVDQQEGSAKEWEEALDDVYEILRQQAKQL